MQATMRELALAIAIMVRALTDMKLRQSTERLGNYLLARSERHGSARTFDLRGEKRVLASLLGMTPENLSRAFGQLAGHGVTIDGPKVQIIDADALAQFAKPDANLHDHPA
jgi:CRP/FNR family transcriptional activator FtrB